MHLRHLGPPRSERITKQGPSMEEEYTSEEDNLNMCRETEKPSMFKFLGS